MYTSNLFTNTIYNGSYYIVVKHRSTLEVWSASPVVFNSPQISYSFTNSITKAFGNKLIDGGGGNFLIFNGDVNQDGIISSTDYNSIYSSANSFSAGYLNQDLNGDHVVESVDFTIVEKNYLNAVSVSKP